jgi:hypothetical protein
MWSLRPWQQEPRPAQAKPNHYSKAERHASDKNSSAGKHAQNVVGSFTTDKQLEGDLENATTTMANPGSDVKSTGETAATRRQKSTTPAAKSITSVSPWQRQPLAGQNVATKKILFFTKVR